MSDAVSAAREILDRIHDENPTYWPYGLDVNQFDGGLYLISKSASTDPVGFVGWQVRNESGRDIGYYAIGVLPEYRQQGFAKSAVASLLREKSATVDEVRAMVMAHNQPSKALASSLGITVIEKLAAIKAAADPQKVMKALGAVLGATGTVVGSDQMMNLDKPVSESMQPWKWDKQRLIMGALNAALGATGGYHLGKGNVEGFVPIAMAPTKDLAFKGIGTLHKLEGLEPATRGALEHAASPAAGLLGKVPKEVLLGALGLGVGALGIGAYSAKRQADAAAQQASAARSGRVKVTLPTKAPGDAETMIDIPIEDINMSAAQRSRLGRDTRRKLNEESRARTRHRKPRDPSALTEIEREDVALEQEAADLEKASTIQWLLSVIRDPSTKSAAAASGAPPNTAVPAPPQPGVNPAMRMQGQRTAVNSIDTSTAANPQIMKAQQDAAAAEATAQQEVAQAQQAQQAKEMESQQKFQQQMADADAQRQQVENEKQVLEMELEKSRIHGELMAEKAKAEKELTSTKTKLDSAGGQESVVDQMTQSRISRIAGRIKAATAAAVDARTGAPTPPPPKFVRSGAMQQLNSNGQAYTAQGDAPPIGIYRTSYGKIPDAAYDWLMRKSQTTPTDQSLTSGLPAATLFGNSNRADMFQALADGAGLGPAIGTADQLQGI